MMTAFEAYRTMQWTTDHDECEAGCGNVMGEGAYVEGDCGHYCSEACRDESEGDFLSDADERKAERTAMGVR